MDTDTSWRAKEAVVRSAAQTDRCLMNAVVEMDNRGKCIVHQSIHRMQQSIGMDHLFSAAMKIKSLYLERDRESTFSVLRGTAAEKSVSDEWNKEERDEDEGNEEGDKEEEEPAERLILAGSTANHPEERPPPEPDPSLHDRLTHRSHNYCETSHSILQFL